MPYYFSGTYCRASGDATVDLPPVGYWEPAYFVESKLWINGTLVKHHIGADAGSMYVYEYALFDSTHFSANSSVNVEFQAMDDYGRLYPPSQPASGSAIVLNRGVSFDRHDFSQLVGGSGGYMAWMKLGPTHYDRLYINDYHWDYHSILNNLGNAGILYINTHGNSDPSVHLTDTDEDGGLSDFVFGRFLSNYDPCHNYFQWRNTLNGSGYPPFNSTHNPPTNLFILEACLSQLTDDFKKILCPFDNAYGDQMADQAVIGWTDLEYIDQTSFRAQLLFNRMRDLKYTVFEAVDSLIQYSAAHWDISHQSGPWQYCTANHRNITFDYLTISGDPYMRPFAVYTGDFDLPSTGWYY